MLLNCSLRELGKTFGYESTYFDLGGGGKGGSYDDEASGSGDDDENSSSSSYILGKKWRDLIPVIKVDIYFLHMTLLHMYLGYHDTLLLL